MMKKKLLCGLLIFVLLFAGCQAQGDLTEGTNDTDESVDNQSEITHEKRYVYPEGVEYSAFCTGSGGDGGLTPAVKNRYPLFWENNQTEMQRDINSTLSVKLEGRNLEGNYQFSKVGYYDNAYSHHYTATDGAMFSVNAKTGKLNFYSKTSNADKAGEKASKDVIVDKAKAFISEFIDPEEYTVKYEWNNNLKYHTVNFVKTINGIETTEKASVQYSLSGNFLLYNSTMLGEFSSTREWAMPRNTSDAIAMAYAEDIYTSSLEAETKEIQVELSIRDCQFILTEDGTLAMLYDVEVKKKEHLDGGGWFVTSDLCEILIFDTAGVTVPVETQ